MFKCIERFFIVLVTKTFQAFLPTCITGALNKCKYGNFYQYIGKLNEGNTIRTLAKHAFAKNTGRRNLDLLTNSDFSQKADVDISHFKGVFLFSPSYARFLCRPPPCHNNISMQAIYMP